MPLGTYILLYVISIPFFMALDLSWLGYIAKDFYQTRLSHLLSESVNWPAAGVFYLIFLAGLVYFAIAPGVLAQSYGRAMFLGGLFGFFTYAAYDLTNMATLANWPLSITIVDIAWGMCLGALVSGATYVVYSLIA